LNIRNKIAARWTAATRHPLLRGWEWVVVTFIASRLIVLALVYLSRLVITRGEYWHPGGVLSALLHFDAELWYIDIARSGYFFSAVEPSSMGFFPFYPMLIWLASFVFWDFRIAGIVVAHVCFLIAALLLNALINHEYDDQRINRIAVTFLMFGPASFFFSHAYSEPTFLMLATGAFLAAVRRQWLIACLCGMCLSATRNIGIFISVPLFLEYLRQIWSAGFDWRPLFHPRILMFALIPGGLALFFLYSYFAFGDPLAYVKATAVWGRTFAPPWRTIGNAQNYPPFWIAYWLIGLLMGLAAYVAGLFLRIRASYMIYASLLIGVYLCGNSLEAIARYMTVVFPLFIAVALLAVRFPSTYAPMLGSSVAMMTLGTVLSAVGFWIT
jgi:hypothetical protein